MKQLCKIIFQVILLVISVLLISKGKMSTGSVITICLLFQQLVKPIDEVYRFMDETASSVIKAKVLLEVTSCAPDEVFDIESNTEDAFVPSIQFKNVLITNPEKDKVLAWYEDLKIPCGKKVALQGASGCGKTTMIRCLNRYYPHIQGDVILFNRKLETYSQKELTTLLYYIPQSTFFFAGTIRDNLIYGLDSDFTDEKLLDVLYKACLVGDYEGVICGKLRDALEYTLSEGAANLSGGQKQRLSLARAFLRSPKMYVFDESTANLDEYTADVVLTNIEEHARINGAGIVYISHDKKVVDRCDEVIEVTNRVTEHIIKTAVA